MSEPALSPRELLAAINANAIEVEAAIAITGPAAVYFSSISADGVPIARVADNDAAGPILATHVLLDSLDAAGSGWAFKRTPVRNFDTHLGAVGDPVYLSATPGQFTLTRPTGAAVVQVVGRITVVSTLAGEFMADLSSANDGGVVNEQVRAQTVAGTTATTNIAITGILTGDRIISVALLNRDATAANINLTDVTSEVSITSNGNIQLSTTNTTGDALLVIWGKRT